MPKQVYFNDDAFNKMLVGIDTTANAVKSTLGPKGQNVFIEEDTNRMIVTKDGVTVARHINLKDKLEEIGSQIVKEASERTNKEAGDGTTTSALLVQYLAKEGLRYKVSGFNPMEMAKGMEKMLEKIETKLKEISKPISTKEDLKAIAYISSNSDEEISDIVSETLNETGKEGVITIEKWDKIGITKEVVQGVKITNGFMHPFMINDYERGQVNFTNPAILLVAEDIQTPAELAPVLDKVLKQGYNQIVILTPEASADVLGFLLTNRQKGILFPLVAHSPSFGDYMEREMEDLGVLLQCRVIARKYGTSLLDIGKVDFKGDINDFIGKCERVVSTMNHTIITGGKGDIKSHVEFLKGQLNAQDDLFLKEKLKDRIAKLTGGVAVIRVGGDTQKEQKEKHYRVEDAVLATKAAMEEGVVAGGGVSYINCYNLLDIEDEKNEHIKAGMKLVKEALIQPFKQLCKISALEIPLDKISEDKGFNFKDEKFGNMLEMKILDPLKVARLALRYAVSTVKLFLTNSVVITNIEEEKKV